MSSKKYTPAFLLPVLILPLLVGCQGASVAQSTRDFPAATGFMQTQVVSGGKNYNMWVFVPKNYTPARKYPAILFLHGLFEHGNYGTKVLDAGLGPVIGEEAEHWPFITIFPQSPGNWRGEDKDALAMAALDYAQQRWSIDRDRVILAGLSYGGLGTWEIGSRHADRFAALVPISGHSAMYAVPHLLSMPVWAFSFTGDPWVNSTNSETMCRTIDAHGGRARLTEFSGIGHDAWPLAVSESQLVPWMLQQHRAAPPVQVTAAAAASKAPSQPSQSTARTMTFAPIATIRSD